MGVLERIESIIKANLNDLISKAKNPERIIEQVIAGMQVELEDARIQMAAAIREGKRLKALYLENQQLSEKWEKKAVLAVQMGNDDLAREAIIRKRSTLALAEEYKQEWEVHEGVIDSLKSAMKILEAKIQEVENRKEELAIKSKQTTVDRILNQSLNDKMSVFKRIENKIMSFGAELEALEELKSNDITSRQRELELEAELEKLKKKLRNGSS